jgi:CHAT domain-containing protein/tetratricopeptide (TPR) repeat protein
LQRLYADARLDFLRGYDKQAREKAEDGLAKAAGFPQLAYQFKNLLSDLSVRADKPADALQILGPGPPANSPDQVRWRFFITSSAALCKEQKYSEADQFLREAETLAQGNPSYSGETRLAEARCKLGQGELQQAERLLQSSLVSSSDDFTEMYAWMAFGFCALRLHAFEQAIDRYAKAEELSRRLLAPATEEGALGSEGYAYSELGDFNRGREKSGRAVEIAAKLGRTGDEAKWALDLGRAYHNTGSPGLALENYGKALTLAHDVGMRQIELRALHNLVQIELVKGQLTIAENHHKQSEALHPEGPDLTDYRRDEASIAAAQGDHVRAEQSLLALLPEVNENPRLTWVLQAELARNYAAQGNTASADMWFQRGVATMTQAAARMKRIEFRIDMLDNWAIFDDYIAFLYSRNETERALQVAQVARARTLAEELGFKGGKQEAHAWVRRIQAMLRRQSSVLLAFYETERQTYAWLVASTTLRGIKVALTQDQVENLAGEYRSEIDQHTGLDASSAQYQLFDRLVKPFLAYIPRGSHVILVPDSALYRINFEALISDTGQPHYWIDDVEIENASSIDLLLQGQRLQRNGKGALIIGAPVQEDPRFPLLPRAHDEVRSVKEQFRSGEAQVFEARSATPDAYLRNPSRYRYIDFATHSEASSADPLQSSIILSTGRTGSFRLFASQIISTQPKLNAELVSISGCYSSGKIGTSAEGLLGLQWAFLRAGAHQVVAGLWDVDDESSPRLMGGLYSGITKGKSPAQALRDAKLKMLHAGTSPRAPYYWASLQLYTGP